MDKVSPWSFYFNYYDHNYCDSYPNLMQELPVLPPFDTEIVVDKLQSKENFCFVDPTSSKSIGDNQEEIGEISWHTLHNGLINKETLSFYDFEDAIKIEFDFLEKTYYHMFKKDDFQDKNQCLINKENYRLLLSYLILGIPYSHIYVHEFCGMSTGNKLSTYMYFADVDSTGTKKLIRVPIVFYEKTKECIQEENMILSGQNENKNFINNLMQQANSTIGNKRKYEETEEDLEEIPQAKKANCNK